MRLYKACIYSIISIITLVSTECYTYDLNSDGYDDIVVSNYRNATSFTINSYIYWGDESNSYSSKTELSTLGSRDNSVADLNGDGYMDIVFSNFRDDTTSFSVNSYIYWGDATASYSSKTELVTQGCIGNSVGDLNGDGYLDIVFCNYQTQTTKNLNSYIYWGDESSSYSSRTELPTVGAVKTSLSDLNGDGYLDIVFSNYRDDNSNFTINSYVYWGDESASYSSKTELPTIGAFGNSVADLNADGYLDIVFPNLRDLDNYQLNSYIYWGDASGSFDTKTELPTIGGRDSTLVDLNADGYMDIVFSNFRDVNNYLINSYIYFGDSTGSYSTMLELPTMGAGENTVADLDNDGYLDIIFANYYDSNSFNTNSYIYWGDETYLYTTRSEIATVAALGITAGPVIEYEEIDAIPEPLSILLLGIALAFKRLTRK